MIANAREHGKKPTHHKGDWKEYHGGAADPTGIRAKLSKKSSFMSLFRQALHLKTADVGPLGDKGEEPTPDERARDDEGWGPPEKVPHVPLEAQEGEGLPSFVTPDFLERFGLEFKNERGEEQPVPDAQEATDDEGDDKNPRAPTDIDSARQNTNKMAGEYDGIIEGAKRIGMEMAEELPKILRSRKDNTEEQTPRPMPGMLGSPPIQRVHAGSTQPLYPIQHTAMARGFLRGFLSHIPEMTKQARTSGKRTRHSEAPLYDAVRTRTLKALVRKAGKEALKTAGHTKMAWSGAPVEVHGTPEEEMLNVAHQHGFHNGGQREGRVPLSRMIEVLAGVVDDPAKARALFKPKG
jgi:hypothetical protein